MIKILHLLLSVELGGLEVMVLDLVRSLDREKYQPIIATIDSENGQLRKAFDEAKIPIHLFKRKKGKIDLSLPFKLSNFIKRNKIDIVHSHGFFPWMYGGLTKMINRRCAHIQTVHAINPASRNLKNNTIEQILYLLTDVLVSDCLYVQNILGNQKILRHKKSVTIYNGINISKFSTNCIPERNKMLPQIKTNDILFGTVARLVDVKNHKMMINAFKQVVSSINNCRLLIVGDGPLMDELVCYSSQLKLEENIIFLGERRDINILLNLMDIFLLSSESEGMSITLVEAISSGLPVVATNVGGNAEIIKHNENGLIVESLDTTGFAKAMMRLAKSPTLRSQYSKKSRQNAVDKFSLEKMTKEYEEIYSECY